MSRKYFIQRSTNLTPALDDAWQSYRRQHPHHTYNAIITQLLTEYLEKEGVLCVTAAPTGTSR